MYVLVLQECNFKKVESKVKMLALLEKNLNESLKTDLHLQKKFLRKTFRC